MQQVRVQRRSGRRRSDDDTITFPLPACSDTSTADAALARIDEALLAE